MLGEVSVRLDGRVLSVANTGAPLDESGVQALAALRASNKSAGTVGRYGVGFTAVLSVSDEVELRSTSGSVVFSSRRTRSALAQFDGADPGADVPALRLAWPTANLPVAGATSEVVLTLRDNVDATALLGHMVREAPDLLLELPSLASITVGGREFRRHEHALASGLTDIAIGGDHWWQFVSGRARWLVRVVDSVVRPSADDVLRAPTRSDEELSIPALLIADVAMQPDRRRVMPGASLAEVAVGYADFVAALPPKQRLAMVPLPGFARSEVDSALREHLLAELREKPWLPTVGGKDRAPNRAAVVPGLSDDLAELLADIVDGLVVPELSGPRWAHALATVDTHRIGLARIAELLSGVVREPAWWARLYAALEPLAVDALAAEELASIPVPLSDGRTVTGPRTVLLGHDIGDVLGVDWTRLVHPEAAHPLLSRLGAKTATAVDLLSDPALRAEIEDLDHDDPAAAADLSTVVLALAARGDPGALPSWLGELLLPDVDGELRGADELLLPGAPLTAVLVDDAPFTSVDSAFAERVGETALRAVGVGWGFTVLRAELPTGPDHDLDDEDRWWDTLDDDPETIDAVRDLDLVDEERWSAALTMLATDPSTRPLLADRGGYTAWWLRHNAELDGQILGLLREPDDDTFTGLLDAVHHPESAVFAAALAAPAVDSPELAQLLLDRLADAHRQPSPAAIMRTHTLLGAAAAARVLDLDELHLPDHVRAVTGAVIDPADALVLDKPWLSAAVPHDHLVVGSLDTGEALADLLDVSMASAALRSVVISTGRPLSWGEDPTAVLAHATLGRPLPQGEVVVHPRLTVSLTGAFDTEMTVPWWVDEEGTTHVSASWAAATWGVADVR
ncbi:ATP-binding protein [Rhodococcus tibetensis]|uniref:ATP-binding protein n=1 Tax=Rhodococcus tibetensis TaxID=2965064 RepID=A0ABT1Q6V8_9NOCA|nr:ATP-binding protein [Rhodococcus sp. FXJ9.536]MCQ4117976.1 ATP-binding protein [Rhodococcus sp. FXJ9.536]